MGRTLSQDSTYHHVSLMRSLVEVAMQLRMGPNYTNVISLLQKALEGLLEGMNPSLNDPDLFVASGTVTS